MDDRFHVGFLHFFANFPVDGETAAAVEDGAEEIKLPAHMTSFRSCHCVPAVPPLMQTSRSLPSSIRPLRGPGARGCPDINSIAEMVRMSVRSSSCRDYRPRWTRVASEGGRDRVQGPAFVPPLAHRPTEWVRCDARSRSAHRWCAAGALVQVSGIAPAMPELPALEQAAVARFGIGIGRANDYRRISHADSPPLLRRHPGRGGHAP